MITKNNMKLAVKTLYIFNVARVTEDNIAENIYIIFIRYSLIPLLNDSFIHFLNRIKSTNFPNELSVMPEMKSATDLSTVSSSAVPMRFL